MSDVPGISLKELTKAYGRNRGVSDLSLNVAQGEIFGFLGPNGAGKTTTIRLMLDLIRPTRGRATILGLDSRADSTQIRRRVGYLPGELALYEASTGRELLEFCAGMRGVEDRTLAGQLEERLGIDLSRRIAQLSRGNKQKIGLLLALFHGPEVLILDEPTSGLDPLVQQEVHALLTEARDEGRTVFLSSHILSEVERVADRVGVIREGRLVAVESIADLRQCARRRLVVTFARPVPEAAFTGVPGVRSVSSHGRSVTLSVEGAILPVLKALTRHDVESLESHEADLEEFFLSYYEPGGGRHAA